jgi:hypothetical protein
VDPPEIDADGDGDVEAAPIYCSGLSFLPDGRVLLAGGNRHWPLAPDKNFVGWEGALTFDPWTETWQLEPDMVDGRWYPSQVLAADGSTFILGGFGDDPQGGEWNPVIEKYLPRAGTTGPGTMQRVGDDNTDVGLYPHLFTLPSGTIALAAPTATTAPC